MLKSSSLGCLEALTATDDREAGTDPDAAAAAYWLRNPEAPSKTFALSDLIEQWETEPEWTPDAGQEDTAACQD